MLPTLRGNIANNTSLRNVRCVHGAIDDSGDAFVNLDVGPSNVSARVCEASKPGRTVPATTLAAVIEKAGVGDFILVSDIEGAEAGMFDRDADALTRCRRMIVELHEATYGGRTYGVPDLIEMVHTNTGMRMRERYGPVCVFDRPSAYAQ